MATSDLLDLKAILVFFVVFLITWWLLGSKKKNYPPGPAGWPLIGNVMDLSKHYHTMPQYVTNLSKTYGPIFMMNVLGQPMIYITDYDMIKEAFVKRSDEFIDRPGGIPLLTLILKSSGVLSTNGDVWKRNRKFALHGLRDFGMGKKSIEYKIQEECRALVEEISSYGNRPWNPKTLLLNAVSNIICSIVFGHRFEYSNKKFQKLVDKVNYNLKSMSISSPAFFFESVAKISPMMKKITRNFDEVDDFIDEQIAEHAESFDPNDPKDFTDLYIQQDQQETTGSEKIPRNHLKGIIRELFLAGTDTTGTALCWGLAYMAKYPEVQRKCQEEIKRVIGSSRLVTKEDKINLPYIEAVCCEIQRHASIGSLNGPHTVMEDTEFHGYTIPKNAYISGVIYSVHRDKRFFGEDVEMFRPERWLDKEGKLVMNEHLIPFSMGPRVCLGEMLARMELFTIFTSLVQHFTFVKESEEAEIDLSPITGLVASLKPYKIVSKLN